MNFETGVLPVLSLIGATGLVLCGGRGRRMGGEKHLRLFNGQPLWRHTCTALSRSFTEVLLVGGLCGQEEFDWIADAQPGLGPLEGLRSGLTASRTGWVACLAVDMPLVSDAVWHALWALRGPEVAAVVPRPGGQPQPMAALYSRAVLPRLGECLELRQLRFMDFLDRISVRYLQAEALEACDPEGLAFENCNTPAQLDRLQRLSPHTPVSKS